MKYFPVFLRVEDKSVVVFGGGEEAAAKLRLLHKTEARIFVVSQSIDHSVLELGSARWIQQSPIDFQLPEDLALAYAATGDQDLDRRLALKVQAFGAVACAVDQIEASNFTTPAIVDRDPVVVAIGTEGTAPVLARSLKASIEQEIERDLGQVARSAKKLRPKVAEQLQPGQPRRRFWKDFFQQARENPHRAFSIAQTLLQRSGPCEQSNQPRLSLIHAPMGKKGLGEDVFVRLFDADVVIQGPGVQQEVLECVRREALHRKDSSKTDQHVAQALREGHHVLVLRETPDWGDLLELSAGFGVLAQVYLPKPRLVACKQLSENQGIVSVDFCQAA